MHVIRSPAGLHNCDYLFGTDCRGPVPHVTSRLLTVRKQHRVSSWAQGEKHTQFQLTAISVVGLWDRRIKELVL